MVPKERSLRVALRSHLLLLVAWASFVLHWHADTIAFAHAAAEASAACEDLRKRHMLTQHP
jgi:hypothetical protein